MDSHSCCKLNSYFSNSSSYLFRSMYLCVVTVLVWIWWTLPTGVGLFQRMCASVLICIVKVLVSHTVVSKQKRWTYQCVGLHAIKCFSCNVQHNFFLHVFSLTCQLPCAYYLSILCNLLGVMPLPLSVKVRHSCPASSTTSIQICLAVTPGSDALSRTQDEIH